MILQTVSTKSVSKYCHQRIFVFRKTEADQIRNETMKLKSQVDQLSQERDELILMMEEEESVASLALHELQSANVSHYMFF